MTAYWDTASCCLVEVVCRFRDAYSIHHQGATERGGRVVNTPASYSGGPRFKSRSGARLS
jgi:hypothetical protein